jgi:tetratricopeptide (TPR) repeat protein
MHHRASLLVLSVLSVLLSGCAMGAGPGQVSPHEIPALERAVEADPADAGTLTRLGVAYGLADRPGDAVRTLERAVQAPSPPTAAWAHLGAWREEAGDVEGAMEAYRRYLDEGGGPARSSVTARLDVLGRELLRREAREAVAMEAELSRFPPDRATVGVLPLLVDGPEEYQALGVGLADLLTTDLSITGRIRVLERAQLAVLLQETTLALGGFTDHTAAARAGRMLRAGRLIQGQVAIAPDLQTRLMALVVDAVEAEAEGQAAASGALEALLDLETALALALYQELGIELTPAERARIEDKPTRNLHAFLAYSQGLQLLDQGDYAGASARFDAAASLDPGFSAAAEAAEQAGQIAQVDPQTVSRSAGDLPGAQLAAVLPGATSIEYLVDSTVPAGPSATATGGGEGSGSTQATSVETTEVTAGTGTGGQMVRVPIIIVRPQPVIAPRRP